MCTCTQEVFVHEFVGKLSLQRPHQVINVANGIFMARVVSCRCDQNISRFFVWESGYAKLAYSWENTLVLHWLTATWNNIVWMENPHSYQHVSMYPCRKP